MPETGAAAGYVQATLIVDGDAMVADVAWVVGLAHQGLGLGRESAQGMVAWLEGQGVQTVRALIHPGNAASAAVARRLRMTATSVVVDGEVRWTRRTSEA